MQSAQSHLLCVSLYAKLCMYCIVGWYLDGYGISAIQWVLFNGLLTRTLYAWARTNRRAILLLACVCVCVYIDAFSASISEVQPLILQRQPHRSPTHSAMAGSSQLRETFAAALRSR